jgi:hypothetical protein
MHAHRLWKTLWMSVGYTEENRSQPEGNRVVAARHSPAAPSLTGMWPNAGHMHCGRPRGYLPAQTPVIPGIHRPYDDYQSFLVTDLNP